MPRVKPKPRSQRDPYSYEPGTFSTFREYRAFAGDTPLDRMSAAERNASVVRSDVNSRAFWRFMLAPPSITGNPLDSLDDLERRVLSKASSAAGGYLTPSDFGERIEGARRAAGVIGSLARLYVTDDGRSLPVGTAPTHGTASWTAENASYSASDEVFGQIALGAFKGGAKVIASEELLADESVDLEAYLSDELGSRLALLEESAFAIGDGSGKPLGVAHASSGISVVTAATGSATSFKLADVRAAWDAVPVAYRANSSWVMSGSAFSSLAGLTDSAGGLVLPSLHLAQPSLFSKPVFVSVDMPAAAANARSVVVGDFKAGYSVRRVRGVSASRQDEIHSDVGQIGWRAFERVDGRPVLVDALRVLANSAT